MHSLAILARKWRSLNQRLAVKAFPFFERALGVHVTPVHFYSPIPDTRELTAADYSRVSAMPGVDMDEAGQLRRLEGWAARYGAEYSPRPNTGLSLLDAFLLHVLVREQKPAHMIEVGSGESTKIALTALERNRAEGADFRFTAVEPYPAAHLRQIAVPGFCLEVRRVQEIAPERLAEADLLFIDSSHVSRIGSDVNHLILEVLPRLKPGAVVHVHDILLPGEYWRDWIESGTKFWNESYLLHAFLLFNSAFEVLWASRHMALRQGEALQRLCPFFEPRHRITSFWLRRRETDT